MDDPDRIGQAIDQAIGILALLRGLPTVEPATRLHLVTSLTHEHGYTTTKIAVLLDLP